VRAQSRCQRRSSASASRSVALWSGTSSSWKTPSRCKAEALKGKLAERGIPAERLARLKAPAGLDLGAITPDEIAISILAEIIAVHRRTDETGAAATT
jgi:hypothetical protein